MFKVFSLQNFVICRCCKHLKNAYQESVHVCERVQVLLDDVSFGEAAICICSLACIRAMIAVGRRGKHGSQQIPDSSQSFSILTLSQAMLFYQLGLQSLYALGDKVHSSLKVFLSLLSCLRSRKCTFCQLVALLETSEQKLTFST